MGWKLPDTTRVLAQGTKSLSAMSTRISRSGRDWSLYLNLRLEGLLAACTSRSRRCRRSVDDRAGDRSIGDADIHVADARANKRQDVGRTRELQRHIARVP